MKIRDNEGFKHGGMITANRTKFQAILEGWQQIRPLFFPPHLLRLILVCVIQLGTLLGLNTLRLWLPQIFQAMNDFLIENEEGSLCEMIEVTKPQIVTNQTWEGCTVVSLTDYLFYIYNYALFLLIDFP